MIQFQDVSLVKLVQTVLYRSCRIGQYLLICLFYTLLTSLSYFYISSLMKLQKSFIETMAWLCIGVWILFNTILNYSLCVLIRPGSPIDIQYNKISSITLHCRTCSLIKVARSHHCSMCNACVLSMDHHCPWIGTCVGHHNRRFFINFITYTMVGLGLVRWVVGQYVRARLYSMEVRQGKVDPDFIFQTSVFVTTLFVVLFGFAAFHWYILIKGKTTLECCFDDPRYTPSSSWRQNIKLVFGTDNLALVFLPSLSILKLKGYEWENKSNFQLIEIEHNRIFQIESTL